LLQENVKIAQDYDFSSKTAQLFLALREEDVDKVEEALSNGADINAREWSQEDPGQTALTKCIRFAIYEIAELLLENGADPYVGDDKQRTAWYYACFGRNIPDGQHKNLMALLLQYWELELDVLFMAMHSPHAGVRLEAMNGISFAIESRDSENNCTIRFRGLGMIDDESASITWPDGSRSAPGKTAFSKMVELEAVESLSHPAAMAVLQWKWRGFGRICLVFDIAFYVAVLLSTSVVALMHDTAAAEDDELGSHFARAKVVNLVCVTALQLEESVQAAALCLRSRSVRPITGRFLHTTIISTLVFISAGLVDNGFETASADVCAAAVLVCWLRTLYFARFSRGFGSFCITMVEMIKRDVTKFILILVIVMPGFVIAMSLLVRANCADSSATALDKWFDAYGTATSLSYLMLGVLSWNPSEDSCLENPIIDVGILFFLLLTMIVLLNLLIAMFSDTYERIQGMAVHTWALNLAQYISEKEVWMNCIRFHHQRVAISKSPSAEEFVVSGKYHDYFLPTLRLDTGDERVEEYILDQLLELANSTKQWHDELNSRVKRIERSLMAQKIKSAAAEALKDNVGLLGKKGVRLSEPKQNRSQKKMASAIEAHSSQDGPSGDLHDQGKEEALRLEPTSDNHALRPDDKTPLLPNFINPRTET